MNPPPTPLPITSLRVIPMHQPRACCILRQTCKDIFNFLVNKSKMHFLFLEKPTYYSIGVQQGNRECLGHANKILFFQDIWILKLPYIKFLCTLNLFLSVMEFRGETLGTGSGQEGSPH